MTTFDNLGLAEPILKAIAAEGYSTPTPIQAKVIPLLLSERDVIGVAQTGTGKTASFVLPLLHRIVRENSKPAAKQCNALILTPTRELAAQIVDNIRAYSRFSNISTTLVVGGVRPGGQIKALSGGVDIVVATPGRLLDHLGTGVINLTATKAIVVDEADQMLDLGFLPSIRKIMAKLPKPRMTALLSATMPGQIRKLADDFLNHPAEVQVAAVSKPVERIAQSVRHVAKQGKRQVLADILLDQGVHRAVVFTRTKRGADNVCKHLIAAGINAAAIHGNKSQPQRDRAMAGFRSGAVTVLVATDIAARGIDIDGVSHVVNFELPNVPETYVHRIGRTARAGRTGIAISLCDREELPLLRDIEKLIGDRLPGVDDAKNGHLKPDPAAEVQTSPAGEPASVQKIRPANRAKQSRNGQQQHKIDPAQAQDGLMRMLANTGGFTQPAA
ncbi:DEAD/DEAH box helicase [Leisingera methylohalidivorans]|uniref:DEAD/DEAH box helicase n=1 Tax=Leisingera methylohalidivorans DSM 14336 TaxID=999552 RepID=V9VQN6_9RHOB|nr:DEAD/DEAH box helicase [Leisingera methylohalidivorans]AHD00009.1 DEAD/DEAH box helicase [Leisingera methylohalidivorans DSM 14336]